MDSGPWRGVVLRPDDTALARHAELFGATPADRVRALSKGIATSPAWMALQDRLRIVIRTMPRPLVGVIGHASNDDRAMLDALGWQIDDVLRRLRPVTYREAETATAALAAQLHVRVGASRLRGARFVGLPRGGLLVAAMLGYVLDLDPWQLSTDPTSADLLVLVDDCMLSGTQLRRWLRDHPSGPPVVAGHLHSHPALRRAIEQQEPRIKHCVAAADLHDHAPDDHRNGYAVWRDRWGKRTPESYWIGNPDHVCYPWNEPDVLVWNDRRERADAGWRVVPPAWCVKNRVQGGNAPAAIQSCDPPGGWIEPADDVLWATLDDAAVVVRAEAGISVRLDGVSAAMWAAVTGARDEDAAVHAIVDTYDADPDTVRADLTGFAGQLAERGFVRHGSGER